MTKWTSEFLFSFVASPIKTFIFRENVISTFSALGLICELHFHCQNGLCLCIMTHYGLFKSINIFISFRKQHLVSTKTFWMPFLLKLFCRMCIHFLQYSVFVTVLSKTCFNISNKQFILWNILPKLLKFKYRMRKKRLQ